MDFKGDCEGDFAPVAGVLVGVGFSIQCGYRDRQAGNHPIRAKDVKKAFAFDCFRAVHSGKCSAALRVRLQGLKPEGDRKGILPKRIGFRPLRVGEVEKAKRFRFRCAIRSRVPVV